ncbi:MAG: penicillin-insensitive murein endopeptidase [Bdellovibrionales bacterium]|nr:penicillin-insensitive murein endopeptidase [Bdellovibrionales bacterium]
MRFLISLVFATSSYAADLSCEPETPFLLDQIGNEQFNATAPVMDFCRRWNPEYGLRKYFCCPNRKLTKKEKKCPPRRAKTIFCDEMSDEQRRYIADVESGKIDVLKVISTKRADQAHCSVNDGFLASGRRLVPTDRNRIRIRNPHRCVDFGTDSMVGMLEYVGRKVHEKLGNDPAFAKTHLLVGDMAAPRGGCLSGRRGKRGHLSHTNGLDVDLGYLIARPKRASPPNFERTFDAPLNWWLLKQVFSNPYACVRAVFLDRKWIAKLAQAAKGDSDWLIFRKYIKHQRNHRNHFHIRVGPQPGEPGCLNLPDPSDLLGEEEEPGPDEQQ